MKNATVGEKATSALSGFHVGFLFWSSWNLELEMLVFMTEENRRTGRKTFSSWRELTKNSTI